MLKKKPTLEKVVPNFGASLLAKTHLQFLKTHTPLWHFHPEVELVYVNKGKGKRHIGNHISYFNNSQLVLIGSNLPHVGYIDRLTTNGSETLVQFRPDFLGKEFFNIPEMSGIKDLLERAKKGIRFNLKIKQSVGPKIEKLPSLKPLQRVTSLLNILDKLANTKDYTLLNADGYSFETLPQDSNKIELIYNHINLHFKEHISLEEIAEIVSMTVPAFCRFFKKTTGKTFTNLVNEYRIVHATKLLAESKISIAQVSFECGFNNFSHFNKQFQKYTGKSASSYKKELKNLVQ